jgi:AbrB family looped-hinge helix DNA binding protein
VKAIATLTSKSQITIPKGVRQTLGLAEGDGLEFTMADGQVIVRAVKPKRSSSGFLHRHLPRGWRAPTVDQMDAGIARHMVGKHGRPR